MCSSFLISFNVGKGDEYISLLISRPFSISIKVTKEEEIAVVASIIEMKLPPRVRLILYLVEPKHKYFRDFPVNLLRNIAIVNIRSSHYIVFDMDMWPARIE